MKRENKQKKPNPPNTKTPPQISSASNWYLQSNIKYCKISFQQWKTAKLSKAKYSKPRKWQYKNLHCNKGLSISQLRYAEVQLLHIRFCSQFNPLHIRHLLLSRQWDRKNRCWDHSMLESYSQTDKYSTLPLQENRIRSKSDSSDQRTSLSKDPSSLSTKFTSMFAWSLHSPLFLTHWIKTKKFPLCWSQPIFLQFENQQQMKYLNKNTLTFD